MGEVKYMDLRGNQITVRELLANSAARGVFERRFGKLMRHPLVGAAQTLTLAQLMDLGKVYLPQNVIRDTLEELKRL